MNLAILEELISKKHIENVDLSELELDMLDFP